MRLQEAIKLFEEEEKQLIRQVREAYELPHNQLYQITKAKLYQTTKILNIIKSIEVK